METTRLGGSDLHVSRVGLGCNNFGWKLDLDATRAVVDAAIDAGVTFLDTADIYGGGESERFLGEILQGRRDRVVLATKFGYSEDPGLGRPEYVRAAIDRSLERLRTDHVDLYYLHRPDPSTPIAETLGALHELVEAGKVRFVGASNFTVGDLREADEVARGSGKSRFVALQNEYSLLNREPEQGTLPLADELDVGFVPYFPLASGLLTGKYRRGEAPPAGSRLADSEIDEERLQRVEALAAFAAERGRTLLELAIAGLAAQPGVASVIAGATSPEQVRANAAAGEWRLSEADRAALAAL